MGLCLPISVIAILVAILPSTWFEASTVRQVRAYASAV